MDAISILAAATSASKAVICLSTGLYNFIDSLRNADQNVQGLQSEAFALNSVLEAIKGTLSTFPQNQNGQLRGHNPGLWTAVLGSLQDCDRTVGVFRSSIDASGNHSTNVAKMISLKFREDGLAGWRTQIRTHTTALNLALQTINIHLSSAGPGLVIDDIGQRIDLVVDMMAQIGMSRDFGQSSLPDPATGAAPMNVQNLVESARQVVVEANEAISRSERGSVFGGTLKPQTQARIEEWIEMYDSETGSRTVDMSSTISESRWTPSTSDAASSDYTVIGNRFDLGDDSDDEFEMEEFESCFMLAEAAFKNDEFSTAEKFYQKTHSLGKLLSTAKQNTLPYSDIFLKIATCSFHEGKLEEAEEAIIRVREAPVVSREDAIRLLQATNLLAEVYLEKNKLEEALAECRKATKGRRRTLGKDSPEYYESLGLLSIIMEKKGDLITAETHKAMIPDTVRNPKFRSRMSIPISPAIPPISPTDKALAIQQLKTEYLPTTKQTYNAGDALYWACANGAHNSKKLRPKVAHLLLSGWCPNQILDGFPSSIKGGESKPTLEDINKRRGIFSRTMLFSVAALTVTGMVTHNEKLDNMARETVELLIKAGANFNTVDNFGHTPLTFGISLHPSIFDILLAAKADPNVKSIDDKTPLRNIIQSELDSSYPSVRDKKGNLPQMDRGLFSPDWKGSVENRLRFDEVDLPILPPRGPIFHPTKAERRKKPQYPLFSLFTETTSVRSDQ